MSTLFAAGKLLHNLVHPNDDGQNRFAEHKARQSL